MATTEALNPSQFSLLTNLTADRSSSPNPQQEMDKVIILVNAEAQASGQMSRLSPVTEKMVIALKNAVPKSLAVEVTGTASLWSKMESGKTGQNNLIWCPLTIQLPNWVNFPGKKVYQACRDIEERRTWVAQTLHYKTSQGDSSFGDLWLPITVTSKGLEYGEVIGEGMIPNAYSQPISLERESLKSLHRLAAQLLDNLQAPLPFICYSFVWLIEKWFLIVSGLFLPHLRSLLCAVNRQTSMQPTGIVYVGKQCSTIPWQFNPVAEKNCLTLATTAIDP